MCALSSGVPTGTLVDDVHRADAVAPPRAPGRVYVGRQAILDPSGRPHGFEFLYRRSRTGTLRVDRWSAAAQDRATQRVLQAVFTPAGAHVLAADALIFVNITRSFLVGDVPLPDAPDRLVLEVVESVRVDGAVLDGVARLRERGFRIAIDDFVGLTGQVALLPHADYVKVDLQDLATRGPALVDLAASGGARLVAERVESAEDHARSAALGFDLFQGFHLDRTVVVNRTPVPTVRTERLADDLEAVRQRTASELTPTVTS